MRKNLYITRLVLFITITLLIEWLGLPQFVTGPFVNMMLFLTTLMLGLWSGVVLGCITPLVASIRGQLPPPLIPMVPFIVIGNALLVVVFSLCKNLSTLFNDSRPAVFFSHWIGIVTASCIKFLFLYFSARLMVPLIFGKTLPQALIALMALPQIVTALTGGAIALLIFQLLHKNFA